MILLDTNVLVAGVVPEHLHHAESTRLLATAARPIIAAHSLAEFYSTLTRQNRYAMHPALVMKQVDSFRAYVEVVSLSVDASLMALRKFADGNYRGPLIYDRLIGEHAVAHNIPTIVTWNTKHMAPLFPHLRVVTPSDL